MQDRYAADAGDFGKFALLRTLAPGERLGVCWFRTEAGPGAGDDGKHVAYLQKPGRYRALEPDVFDRLGGLVRRAASDPGVRSVPALEQLRLLPGDTLFHRVTVPGSAPARRAWATGMAEAMKDATLLFADPDNGIARRSTIRHAPAAELRAVAGPRPALCYHHQGRTKGGARAEFALVRERLIDAGFERVSACRLRMGTSRFYFLANGSDVHVNRMKDFCARWGRLAEWFPGD